MPRPLAREALCTRRTVDSLRPTRWPWSGPRTGARSRSVLSLREAPRPSVALPDLVRGGTSFRGDQQQAPHARPAHIRSRHQRPAGRSRCHGPLRRARSRAPDRGGHGTGGQTASPRARILRPAGPAPAGRLPGPVRQAGRPDPARGSGRDAPRRAQPLRSRRPARRLPVGGQRLTDSRGRTQPPGRGVRRHGRLQGPAAPYQGLLRGSPRRGVPRGARHHGLRLDRYERTVPRRGTDRPAVRRGDAVRPRGRRTARPHRSGPPVRARQGARPGDGRGQRTARAGRPGGLRHPRAQCRTADRPRPPAGRRRRHRVAGRPAPASRRWPSARGWRPCWSAGSTRR